MRIPALIKRLAVLALFVTVPGLHAQKGIAPNGYYPLTYQGDTFTGRLLLDSKDSSKFTLVYSKDNKSETFAARLESKCHLTNKAGETKTFQMEAFTEGAVMTAYYRTEKNKTTHQKENVAFALTFAENKNGAIPNEKRVVISCTEESYGHFKAFD